MWVFISCLLLVFLFFFLLSLCLSIVISSAPCVTRGWANFFFLVFGEVFFRKKRIVLVFKLPVVVYFGTAYQEYYS